MSTLADLVAACKHDPDFDAPRLILADWLDEHGQCDRADVLRRQVLDPKRTIDARLLPEEMIGAWKQLPIVSAEWPNCEHIEPRLWYERGFLRVADIFHELFDNLTAILDAPYDWTWIDGIKFGSWGVGEQDWSSLFQSPRLLELNWLEFSDDYYDSTLSSQIAKSPHLTSLRHLQLFDVKLEDEGVRRLSQVDGLRELTSLDLTYCGMARRGMKAFAASEVWDNLRVCNLHGNRLGDTALLELATGRHRPLLTSLDVADAPHTDAGLLHLARSDRFPALRQLKIGWLRFDDQRVRFGPFGVESLLNATNFTLDRLTLRFVKRGEPSAPMRELFELAERLPDRVKLELHDPGGNFESVPGSLTAAQHETANGLREL